MSRLKVTLLATLVLCIGIAIGAVGGFWYSSNTFVGLGGISIAANTSIRVKILDGVRAGDQTKAIEMLESMLDSDLIAIDAMLREDPSFSEASLFNALRAAKEYRRRFPRTTGSIDVDQTVQKALSRVPDFK